MRIVFRWLGWAITVLIIYKAATWSYDYFLASDQIPDQQDVVDIDKECRMDADTGRCICRHKRTGEYLQIPYDECKSRALDHR